MNVVQAIRNHSKEARKCWDTLRSFRRKGRGISTNISSKQWYVHFKNVFNPPSAQPGSRHEFIERKIVDDVDGIKCESLNLPITEDEIRALIKALKNQKPAGPDGLIVELYKNSSGQILSFLVEFFNH